MSAGFSNELMSDVYIFETSNLLEQLENLILAGEKANQLSEEDVNEIFRIMHTIKGSSAMMLFDNIASVAHTLEDLFYFVRENDPPTLDFAELSDIVLEGVDFFKVELEKVRAQDPVDGDARRLEETIAAFLLELKAQNSSPENEDLASNCMVPAEKTWYEASLFFEEGCQMENIRAYSVIQELREMTDRCIFCPEDILDNDDSAGVIREQGFKIVLSTTKSYDDLHKFFWQTVLLKELLLEEIENPDDKPVSAQDEVQSKGQNEDKARQEIAAMQASGSKEKVSQQSIISVNVVKLDSLMDLVGEMVIAEAMVTQNPDIRGLQLDNFQKAARRLGKIIGEVQDMVMAIRMVPLSVTFHKMQRIIRDMSKKLGKAVRLEIIGEETEVDKNIIEHISDPLMHLIRNAIDHGLEETTERLAAGKPQTGMITLEAKNAGSDVLVSVRDDGKGLNRDKILEKARQNRLLSKPEEEMTDREILNLIFLPGFSTKENVTEFSGRGVGMDVVSKNIQAVGGTISVDSAAGAGTAFTMKIPLTLAIIGGMNIRVGDARYTLPTISVRESFRPQESDIIRDPDGNEMIMVRGKCYPIIRLHERYKVKKAATEFSRGIFIMVENEEKSCCLFADELLGEQQVVVKALPQYIQNFKKDNALGGCTLLGDGSISLILDIQSMTRLA